MLYPEDIEQKLGFDKVRLRLKKYCSGELGISNVDKVKFSSNPALIQKLNKQTEVYMGMIRAGEKIPALNYPEIVSIHEKLRIQGNFLEIRDRCIWQSIHS